MTPEARLDVHSFARPSKVRVTHASLDWRVLFEQKVLEGSAVLSIARDPSATGEPLRLDTRDLQITGVTAGTSGNPGGMQTVEWNLGARDPILGSELIIKLPDAADRVRVEYRTSPEATGLQWLAAEQTAGGKHPFLYTQSQAIHARSWIPCQDSPAVRITFEATVHVPPPLRAVMAAPEVPPEAGAPPGVFRFKMPYAIPSYLIALAVGDLTTAATGPRTAVWAEPQVTAKAAYEFADMEQMLKATEATYGPYRWGRYDLLVLPPSFPFGGMENPTLTFATPTVLAGDRSLVALVAHEMAHSWSGNLVTNATWSDFWLNEGFTTYLERRIMEAVYGRARADMEWMLGRQTLEKEIASLADKPGDQVLEIDLKGRDPDDGFTEVPYEKGALLLRLLEETYGRAVFDDFLKAWFDGHAFTSVTTDDLRSFLDARLFKVHQPVAGRTPPSLETWLTKPGLPDDAPRSTSDAFTRVDEAVAAWSGGKTSAAKLDTKDWSTHQWIHFLRALPKTLTTRQMAELDGAFGFTKIGNSEVLDEWLVLVCRHGYEPGYTRLEQFLTSQGRRKYLKPIYEELAKTDDGRRRGLAIYAKGRPLYQAIARQSLDVIVGWKAPPPAK